MKKSKSKKDWSGELSKTMQAWVAQDVLSQGRQEKGVAKNW